MLLFASEVRGRSPVMMDNEDIAVSDVVEAVLLLNLLRIVRVVLVRLCTLM